MTELFCMIQSVRGSCLLIKSSQAISHVKWLKFSSISGTISVLIIRLTIYLYPELPTYIHAGTHVLAKCKPVGASGQTSIFLDHGSQWVPGLTKSES
jgi:hypothetical protein